MICAVFYNSGFKRTLCGSKWDPVNGITGSNNAFANLGSSTARYGCCPANTYMSSPEGTGTFVEADSCSACPVGTTTIPATFVANDEIRCFYDKMPDGCTSKAGDWWIDRSCYPRKAVDELNADGSGTHPTYGPMKDWDMSLVTDISFLFQYKTTLNADLSSWDVSRVTTLHGST